MSTLNPEVQSKLTVTLGKHAIVIKVLANVDRIYKFHTQPPAFRMPGVKEYGTKIFGSVPIGNLQRKKYLMSMT